ncbi:MAG: tRNA modification GTPase TrmE [Spartobacteria bacterium]|nr:tRNA modification GTPase TrmE [Spartobacteria bacterium]
MRRGVEGNRFEERIALRNDPFLIASDTIAAISTPAGEGAIALVRLSGPKAVEVADKIFWGREKPSQFLPQVQHLGEIREADRFIDQAMLSVHRAPASYTGEDVIEISCHGGVLVSARVLETCLGAGARAARPGEFTQRAFLNGKMDLTQAEAVIDLIRAKTDLALRSAMEQLGGALGQRIRKIRDDLVSLLAHIEASIDFSDEGIHTDETKTLALRLQGICGAISQLLNTADQGRILREGVRIVIYGATNAGKSSLLNRLVGHERVIVSETHGTTRDTIEETINLRGLPVRLVDTAGLRASTEGVEREGIARTEKSLLTADLRLHIADRSLAKPTDFDAHNGDGVGLVVLNKSDLPEHDDWEKIKALRISCITGEGLSRLEEEICARITKENLQAENLLAINARHRDCLRRALEHCQSSGVSLQKTVSPEYVAVDLNGALKAVGEVIGAVDVENVLDSVFGQFCIGK